MFIHIEPDNDRFGVALMPVQNIDGLDSRIYGHFGRSPYFIILNFNNELTDIEDFYLNEFLENKENIGLNVVKSIINYKIDLLFVSRIGEISFHILKNNFIDIYKVEKNITVKKVIKQYRLNQLSPVTELTYSIKKSLIAKLNQ